MICITMVHSCGFEIRPFKVHYTIMNLFCQVTEVNSPGTGGGDAGRERGDSQVKHWLVTM